jgi:hypothetical protein
VQSVRSVKLMAAHVSPKNGEPAPLVAEDVADIIARVRPRRPALRCARMRGTALTELPH